MMRIPFNNKKSVGPRREADGFRLQPGNVVLAA